MKLGKKLLMPFRRKIKTEAEYNDGLKILEALMEKGDSLTEDEADYMELLGVLLEDYERAANPSIATFDKVEVTPVDAIRWAMDRHGLKQKELCPYIGSEQLVSAVMNGARSLSKAMIVRLHEGLGIPYEDLMPKAVTYRKVAMF